MRFDVNRLAVLSGINSSDKKRTLNEAQNRSYQSDPGFSEPELDYISQLNEEEEEEEIDVGAEEDFQNEAGLDFDVPGTDVSLGGTDDVMLEINESELRREILAMRKNRNRESLEEQNLRKAIRNEISHILNDVDLNISGGWVYGKNKPQNSKKGNVARGFFGIGFK